MTAGSQHDKLFNTIESILVFNKNFFYIVLVRNLFRSSLGKTYFPIKKALDLRRWFFNVSQRKILRRCSFRSPSCCIICCRPFSWAPRKWSLKLFFVGIIKDKEKSLFAGAVTPLISPVA